MNKMLKEMVNDIKRFGLKWEFIRRNEEYKKDYDSFIKAKSEKSKGKWSKTVEDKYGLSEPLDPDVSFLKALKEEDTERTYEISQIVGYGNQAVYRRDYEYGSYLYSEISSLIAAQTSGSQSYSDKELEQKKVINIQINIDAPKQKILHEVERIIDMWRNLKKEKKVFPKERSRVEHYEDYLNVVDLKDKEGLEWNVIIKKKNYKKHDDKDYAKKVAKRDYQRGKKMIEGGFRQIR